MTLSPEYSFVPYTVGENYYSIVGELNLEKVSGGCQGWTLAKRFQEVGKDKWDLSLTDEHLKEISKLALPLGALDQAAIEKSVSYGKDILQEDFGLDRFNGGSDAKFGENCKRVFSKYCCFDYGKGYVLCEGFTMKCGNSHGRGLVVRFTYGDLVKKLSDKINLKFI